MGAATVAVLVAFLSFGGLAGCAKQAAPAFLGGSEFMQPTLQGDDAGADSTMPVTGPPDNNDASLVVSIGDGASDAPPGTTVSLVFDPPSATVVIDGTGPQSASFTLKATDSSGNVKMVSPYSIQFDRPDLGSVTLALPVVATAPATASPTPYGGTGTIHAIYEGLEATAAFTVQVHLTQYAMGLSATSPAVIALNPATDAGTPLPPDPAPNLASLLYPYDHTVWPLGLQTPLLMWNAPQAMDVYRLHYTEKNYTVDSFTTLAALPGQTRLDQTIWDRLTNSNDTLHGGQDSITFTLSRWDSVKQMAYASASQTWTVAPESLRGAIYYWSASGSAAGRIGHIARFQPGPGAAPQVLNNGVCMGCHAVNAQGTVLVGDVDDQKGGAMYPSVAPYDNWSKTRAWGAFDITQPNSPSIYQSNKFGADIALTPDGKYLVFGGPAAMPGSKYLSLGDPRTGMVIPNSGLDMITLGPGTSNLEMPAFSPDGKMLALVESQWTGSIDQRDNVLPAAPERIVTLKFNEAAPSFDPTLTTVVDGTSSAFATTGAGLAYPSFTPDSKAIAFHAGKTSTGCNAGCDDAAPDDGNLFLTLVSGGTPIRLAAANDPPNPMDHNASVEPTFNPLVRGGYSWAVFTSMRAWGNQPWPAAVATYPKCQGVAGTAGSGLCNAKRRLWVTAVDTNLGTTDPSHPAIYLEGQEDTPNMRGFYTLASCIPTYHGMPVDAGVDDAQSSSSPGIMCANGFECCSGFCDKGICIEPGKQSCVGLGGMCTMTSDCCNAGVVMCLPAADGGMVCGIGQAK